jgi:catechol 2,3-dioxygenase
MGNLPEMTFGHIGLNVTAMDPMVAFYTEIMGFSVTDRGHGSRGGELAFLSRNPEEHHQIVLAEGRPVDNVSTVNQMSFRVTNFGDVRAMYERLVKAGVKGIAPIDHGAALSVYFPDPEGNRVEVYWATPWYIRQPHAKPIDFSKSDAEILGACEAKCRADPSFQPMDEWKKEFAKAG